METTSVVEQQALLAASDALGRAVVANNLRHGFIQFPDTVFSHPQLPRRAKLVYGALLKYARQKDYCWPTQAKLAADCSMSVDTVQRGLKDLRSVIFRVDPDTHQVVIETTCPACLERQQREPDEKKRRRVHCDQHSYGLVEWKQRGLNKSNLYQIVPLFSSLEELEAQLALASQADVSGKPHDADSTSRNLPGQDAADCGTNHTENEKHLQGNKDSNSNASEEETSYSHRLLAIGISNKDQMGTDDPSNRISNPPLPKEEEVGAGAARAKAAEVHTSEHHAQATRALAAAGIDVRHFQELDTRYSPEQDSADHPRLSPALKQMIRDFSEEFSDMEHFTSNSTRAARICDLCQQGYGDKEEKLVEFLYSARAKAKKAVMQDRTSAGKPARMKYFFTCLENETGYRQHCPKCGKDCRAESLPTGEGAGYHWVCRCGHDFMLKVS